MLKFKTLCVTQIGFKLKFDEGNQKKSAEQSFEFGLKVTFILRLRNEKFLIKIVFSKRTYFIVLNGSLIILSQQ